MTPGRIIRQHIRRDHGSFVDIDFYRARAIALRREAMRDFRTVRATSAGLLMVLGVLAIVALTTSPAMPNGGEVAAVRSSHAAE